MADYEFWLTDDRGMRIANEEGRSFLDNVLWLSAAKEVNAISYFSMGLPSNFDMSLLINRPDQMVQIWRAPNSKRLTLWGVYFIRKLMFRTTQDGLQFAIGGPNANDLLRRRIVAAFTGSAQSDKTDFGDDMMKEVVTEALADGVAPIPDAGTRAWSNLAIQGEFGLGPTITSSMAFKSLLLPSGAGAIGELAKACREAGTEVFFDIVTNSVSPSSIAFEFRTYTGQPGQDVTSTGILFDSDRGNMLDPFLEIDYTEEVNYAYGGGQDADAAREIQQAYDATRYNQSIWNRCEGFADARDQSAADGVRETARAAVEAGRPIYRFGATPLDTPQSVFGIDWDYGYKVRAKYLWFEFDAIIRAVVLSLDGDGNETIQARLEYEGT